MKKFSWFTLFFLCFTIGFTQIQTNEVPPSFRLKQQQSVDNAISIPSPDINAMLLEDAKDEALNNKPWRFGALIPVNYTLQNAGQWSTNDNLGTEIWALTLTSSGAKSINLNFDDFYLNDDAKLFIYTSKNNIIGAITSANNKVDRLFSTRPLQGDRITLELHVPQNKKAGNVISIEGLVYGYKDFQEKVNKVFQSSGNCNINVNCSEGDNWTDQRRSVAMITTAANTRFCTGALVNNVRQDTTPYFLTAAHCGVRNNSVFIFGYQSPNCSPNTDGQLTNSISGSIRRGVTGSNTNANNTNSDFDLRELSVSPPASFNVFYSGWSAIDVPALNSTCIHHPSGDVMKISIDNDPTTNSSYYRAGTTHWQVSNWESGTTEGGSSGSPLFDQNQRVVGQLHGGDASCTNNSFDYFGKFSHSWNFFSSTANQLKNWLDPDNTGTLIMDGLDPNPANFANDLHLFGITGIEDYECGSSIQPSILVRNVGNAAVNSFSVQYRIGNGNIQTQSVTTSLARNQMEEVLLPAINLPFGATTFYAEVVFNAPQTDGNPSNNIDSVSTFANTANTPELLMVEFKTDDYGSESSWEIIDRNSNLVLGQGSGYANVTGGQIFRDTFCIHNSCYDFNMFDSQGDGFDGNFGNGYLVITNSLNDTLINLQTFTGSTFSDTFCITTNNITSIAENNFNQINVNVYPNPINKGQLLRISDAKNYQLRLFDVQGRLMKEVFNQSSIEIGEEFKGGIYILELIDPLTNIKVATQKVIVQ